MQYRKSTGRLLVGILAGLLIGAPAFADTCFQGTAEEQEAGDDRFRPVTMVRLRLRESRVAPAEAWATFKGSDTLFNSTLECWAPAPGTPEGAWQCAASCNGGGFTAWREGSRLLVETRGGFLVGDACAGGEAAGRVTYRYAVKSVFRLRQVDREKCRKE